LNKQFQWIFPQSCLETFSRRNILSVNKMPDFALKMFSGIEAP
jgi:hypothetical protein